ncbi:MAG TPA: RHS repeat-associated core domain-containing protein [Ignavibacteria bacterium]|nr:RHS repeat-associated core domain-containing protein [Ignavibacteria bacterium]
MWNIIAGFDTLITDYSFNSQDQATDYSHFGNNEKISFRNSYDYAGRLSGVDKYDIPDAPNPDFINLAEYDYNENSQVSQQRLNAGGLKINYYYNNRQWISEILETGDVFNMINDYFKNGNVKSQQLSGSYNDMFSNASDLYQNYKYDKSNRLLETENNNQQYKDHYKIENKYDKDGNILELKRYDGTGAIMDNFDYDYYSGTNRLQRVTGSQTQYTYDANGNMITDELNQNRDIKYDHRNLITQIRNKKIIIEDSLVYVTYYFYDEAGNRIRKNVYQYIGIQPSDSVETPDLGDITDMTGYWDLIKDEVYSRDLSGKEVALYVNGNIMQNNIWGLGNEGYITSAGALNFYLKDHLGSIRAVTDENNSVISAQDYDCWGYLMQSRQYDSDESVYKFTGKERDMESFYDYFGYRNYDSRIGKWNAVDPMFEKYIGNSPYVYVLDNPLLFIDTKGADIDISGLDPKYKNKLIENLSLLTGLSLFEENGLLKFRKNEKGKAIIKGGSKQARILLKRGINEGLTKVYNTVDKGSISRGFDIGLDPIQIEKYISGTSENLNKNTMGWGMVFLHEFLHTESGGNLSDPKDYGAIGEVESIMNEIRKELGEDYGYRASYQSLEVYDGFKYIPFDLQTKKQIEKNIIPSINLYYIKY